MDEEGFVSYMKKQRKTERTISTCVDNVKDFEDFLKQHGTSLEKASKHDLESFAADHLEKKRVSKVMWGLSHYFRYVGADHLLSAAGRTRETRVKASRTSFKLRGFRGVDPKHASRLSALGVDNTKKMLEAGKTPLMRDELSERSGLDISVIEELVRLSDLARIQGVKGIRARLYYDAGFDLLEKLRNVTPETLLAVTREFVKRTGFDGIAPLPKEAQSAIATAKKLPDLVEW
ncbi:MAG: DUF4332 domain-containing protein [Candidatus Thorarchaeota archaeon]|nr:DUF4332 domain-containing protein [Candidatus Thorarchaeota archaeon]